MIRRNGENVSAREVESVIAQAPGVGDVAAIPVPHETRGEDVKIYVIPEQMDNPPTAEDLIAFAAAKLAPFKVPRYVEFVNKFPRTPSGKIAKNLIKAAKPDLREGAWDHEEKRQR